MRHTVTSTVLLEGLRRSDNETLWSDYVGRYRPLLVRHATQVGFPPSDAEDVAQQALLAFAEAYREGKYDREKGRLRNWLFGIARTTLRNHRRRAARQQQLGGSQSTAVLKGVADEDRWSEIWEAEWQRALLEQCLLEVAREVEPQTLRAFELFGRQGRPAHEVAAELGITENAVFGAKRRVLRRIRELLPAMEENW